MQPVLKSSIICPFCCRTESARARGLRTAHTGNDRTHAVTHLAPRQKSTLLQQPPSNRREQFLPPFRREKAIPPDIHSLLRPPRRRSRRNAILVASAPHIGIAASQRAVNNAAAKRLFDFSARSIIELSLLFELAEIKSEIPRRGTRAERTSAIPLSVSISLSRSLSVVGYADDESRRLAASHSLARVSRAIETLPRHDAFTEAE